MRLQQHETTPRTARCEPKFIRFATDNYYSSYTQGDSQNDYNSAPCSRLSHALSDVGTHRLSSLVPLTVDTPSEDRGFY
ncbi:hypothetical protein PC118_g15401 [Phytophthora cactorum]|uniref:Uncharacterized protein n=1 Tax=Phytophthora cactorum TaxID=29920 RepID=A0A8T1FNY5_9STRA|nr:hypothetical protein PC118_g15401 [Phytophthora cactorum]